MKLVTTIAIVLFLPATALATTLYVPDDFPAGIQAAISDPDPTTALATTWYVPDDFPAGIQAAISDPAVVNGDTIIVRPDIYFENLNFLGKAITVKSEAGPVLTIIDGNQAGSVVTFDNNEDQNSVLDGFTITNGFSANGGGIYVLGFLFDPSTPVIRNNIILGNTASGTGLDGSGGGICCDESAPSIEFNYIANNIAKDGGGISSYGGDPSIKFNHITGNTASVGGGGLECHLSSAEVIGNIVDGNTSLNGNPGGGGMMFRNWSSATVINNLVFNNSATYGGGGICVINESEPEFSNLTVVGNSSGDNGGGFYEGDLCGSQIVDSIFWDNSASLCSPEIHGFPAVDYSCIEGGWSTGTGNIDSDPLFVTGLGGDHYLSQILAGQAIDSPCVDTGDPSSVMIDGTTRSDGVQDTGIIDMGYHYSLPVILHSDVDFKPDTLNLKSNGRWVTCYIELPAGHTPEDIDVPSVFINSTINAVAWPYNIGDYDCDGVPDLMVKFDRQAVQATLNVGSNVEIKITGELTDGTAFEGIDYIKVIPGNKKTK